MNEFKEFLKQSGKTAKENRALGALMFFTWSMAIIAILLFILIILGAIVTAFIENPTEAGIVTFISLIVAGLFYYGWQYYMKWANDED